MKQSILERASWIAGIVSAAIALIAWLGPFSYQQQKDNPDQKIIHSKEAIETRSTPKSVAKVLGETKIDERWSCDGVSHDLQPAFEAARGISYSSRKDETMISIARKALCIQNYQLFEQAANEISYSSRRDQAYVDGVDFTLNSKKFTLAEKYAAKISYSSTQDAARKRIVLKASQK